MNKTHLITPGPTPVPQRALLAMAREMIHHRGPEFKAIFAEVREHLKWLVQTEQEVLTLTCSGTGAFESAIINFTRKSDKLLAIGGGKFGERWGKVADAYGMQVVTLDVEWGQAADPAALKQLLLLHPDTAMVTLCASETSTGVFHPVQEIAEVVRNHSNALIAIDAITALGVHPMPMDAWGIDIVVGGSQKAFSLPPGLGFVAASTRAWERAKTADHPRFYFDLNKEHSNQLKNQTAYTPAVSLIVGLLEVLQMMREEGLEAMFARHTLMGDAAREGVKALGLGVFAEHPANSVTTVRVPEPMSATAIVSNMKKQGIILASGQDHLKEFTFRIGHLGYYDFNDILVALGGIERAMVALGYEVTPGAGLAAAQHVFERKYS